MELDIECLRNDLLNYFGSATFFNQFAYVNVLEIENASDYQLVEIALKNGFDLNDYVIKYLTK